MLIMLPADDDQPLGPPPSYNPDGLTGTDAQVPPAPEEPTDINTEAPADAVPPEEAVAPLPQPYLLEAGEILALKARADYRSADALAWSVLADFGIDSVDRLCALSIDDWVDEIPVELRPTIAIVVLELGKSFEMFAKNEGLYHTSSDVGMKLFLTATYLDPDNSEAPRRLADNAVHISAEQFAEFRSHVSYDTRNLSFSLATKDEALIELRTETLIHLQHALGQPPMSLTAEHTDGTLPFPHVFGPDAPVLSTDLVVEVTWALGNAAKLAVLVSSRYQKAGDLSNQLLFAGLARDYAGSIFAAYGISRSPQQASDRLNALCREGSPFGDRSPNVAHAASSLGSAAELFEDRTTARIWYAAALKVDPHLRFPADRLARMPEGGRARNYGAVAAILSTEALTDSGPRFASWDDEFAGRVRAVSPSVLPRIKNDITVLKCSDLEAVVVTFAQRMGVIFGETGLGDVFVLNSEKQREEFWGTANELPGFLGLRAEMAIIQILIDRKIATAPDRAETHLGELQGISDAYIDVVEPPDVTGLLELFRTVADWVYRDLPKK